MTAASIVRRSRVPQEPPAWIPATHPTFAAPLRALDAFTCTRTEEGAKVEAILEVGAEPGSLAGHFPGFPILPGVFVLESVAQAASLAVGGGGQLRPRDVHSARFLAPLLGGDQMRLVLDLRAGDEDGDTWRADARAHRADGTVAARLRLTLAPLDNRHLNNEDSLPPAALSVVDNKPNSKTGNGYGAVESGSGTAGERTSLLSLLPHRGPALLLDRITALDPGGTIHAEKRVTASEPCYRRLRVPDSVIGTPGIAGMDLYPVSLMLESLGQAAALLWLSAAGPAPFPTESSFGSGSESPPAAVPMFAALRDYRVYGAARPGDVLCHVASLSQVAAGAAFASGRTYCSGRLVAGADSLIAVRRPPPSAPAPSPSNQVPRNTGDEEAR